MSCEPTLKESALQIKDKEKREISSAVTFFLIVVFRIQRKFAAKYLKTENEKNAFLHGEKPLRSAIKKDVFLQGPPKGSEQTLRSLPVLLLNPKSSGHEPAGLLIHGLGIIAYHLNLHKRA
ncbi:MAG: hypothetical protein ACJ76F_11400 [Bacteroidia bacterium]